jgi:hypothetical protein
MNAESSPAEPGNIWPIWRSEEKQHSVATTIRNLVVLGWVRAQVSEELIEVA